VTQSEVNDANQTRRPSVPSSVAVLYRGIILLLVWRVVPPKV
jgi:hypothetical protein